MYNFFFLLLYFIVFLFFGYTPFSFIVGKKIFEFYVILLLVGKKEKKEFSFFSKVAFSIFFFF